MAEKARINEVQDILFNQIERLAAKDMATGGKKLPNPTNGNYSTL